MSILSALFPVIQRHFKMLLCWVALLSFSVNIHAEEVSVWTYYPDAPFTTADAEGLNYDFIQLLNKYSLNHDQLRQYQFKLNLIPRSRINRNLKDEVPGIVLFVNWVWMGDKGKSKYLWSDAVLTDRNEIASRAQGQTPNRINYDNVDLLKGLTFGGVTGRIYKGLEDSFKSGEIKRQDVREEEQNLDLLLHGRIDITSMAASVLNYKLQVKGIQDQIYLSPTPLISYTRHFLITRHFANLEPYINQFISSLKDNPEWHQIKQKYAVR